MSGAILPHKIAALPGPWHPSSMGKGCSMRGKASHVTGTPNIANPRTSMHWHNNNDFESHAKNNRTIIAQDHKSRIMKSDVAESQGNRSHYVQHQFEIAEHVATVRHCTRYRKWHGRHISKGIEIVVILQSYRVGIGDVLWTLWWPALCVTNMFGPWHGSRPLFRKH